MNDGRQETYSSNGVHDLSIQNDKEVHGPHKGDISHLEIPLSRAIDEWWLTQKQDGPVLNKYTITSTGNGNVDISRD